MVFVRVDGCVPLKCNHLTTIIYQKDYLCAFLKIEMNVNY